METTDTERHELAESIEAEKAAESKRAPVRNRFPILDQKTYLNNCSQGALSVDVQRAYRNYLKDWVDKGAPWDLWVERMESARNAFAGLVGAEGDEVAVTTSVSHAVSALASSFDFDGDRSKIVMTDFEFPTIGHIWHAQERRGVDVVHVPAAGNRIPLEYFDQAIDDRTLLVSITHVCYRNGSRLPVEDIIEMAHARGAMVLLDSYQALGTFPVDVKRLNVDFLAGGALKYLLGSAGLAFLYVRKQLIEQLEPTFVGWFSQANIYAMDPSQHVPSPSARRFEAGTPPVPNIYAGLAGMKLIQRVGLPTIEKGISEVTSAIKEGAMQRGYNLVSPVDPAAHGALITLRSHKVDMLVKRLKEEDIITSSRDENLRISAHFYNDQRDVDRLMDALEKHQELLV